MGIATTGETALLLSVFKYDVPAFEGPFILNVLIISFGQETKYVFACQKGSQIRGIVQGFW